MIYLKHLIKVERLTRLWIDGASSMCVRQGKHGTVIHSDGTKVWAGTGEGLDVIWATAALPNSSTRCWPPAWQAVYLFQSCSMKSGTDKINMRSHQETQALVHLCVNGLQTWASHFPFLKLRFSAYKISSLKSLLAPNPLKATLVFWRVLTEP